MNSAIDVKNLTVRYGSTLALSNICLDISCGEYLGIIGPNGGGKSTLLSAILGLVQPDSGEICVLGASVKKNRSKIGYVPQFAYVDRKFPITVLEVAMTAQISGSIHPFFRYSSTARQLASEQLEHVGLQKLAKRQVSELSGGEFQRLLIARALTARPEILLLDEPTASVDPSSREHIYKLLSALNSEGLTIVLVTHDMMAISSNVHAVACLNQTLVYHGAPDLTTDAMNHMYGCPVDIIAHGVPHRVLQTHGNDNCAICGGEHGHHDYGSEDKHDA